jgi:hypothetical protein
LRNSQSCELEKNFLANTPIDQRPAPIDRHDGKRISGQKWINAGTEAAELFSETSPVPAGPDFAASQ